MYVKLETESARYKGSLEGSLKLLYNDARYNQH